MSVMWWWAVPVTCTLAAWAIVLWRSRESVHRDPVLTVQRLSRFRGAMARVHADASDVWHAADNGQNADPAQRSALSVDRPSQGQS